MTQARSTESLRKALIQVAKKKIRNDLSHDFDHALRVLKLAEIIAEAEGADLRIIIPAALFHDLIVYGGLRKGKGDSERSASLAAKILEGIDGFPRERIPQVSYAIRVCSFAKNVSPETLEARILQDADMLEATGAVAIARTFGSSSVIHNRAYFSPEDPLCRRRSPNDRLFSLDLFFTRLLKIEARLHTKTAKKIAKRRVRFLRHFLEELELELGDKTPA